MCHLSFLSHLCSLLLWFVCLSYISNDNDLRCAECDGGTYDSANILLLGYIVNEDATFRIAGIQRLDGFLWIRDSVGVERRGQENNRKRVNTKGSLVGRSTPRTSDRSCHSHVHASAIVCTRARLTHLLNCCKSLLSLRSLCSAFSIFSRDSRCGVRGGVSLSRRSGGGGGVGCACR